MVQPMPKMAETSLGQLPSVINQRFFAFYATITQLQMVYLTVSDTPLTYVH